MKFLWDIQVCIVMALSEESRWNIIKSEMSQIGLLDHQIGSYDNFLNHGIEDILENHPVKLENRTYVFKNCHIPKPFVIEEDRHRSDLFPIEARNRDLTYSSPILVDVIETLHLKTGDQENIFRRIKLCNMPIMIRSSKCHLSNMTSSARVKHGECEYDKGGYFVVRGKERVLVSQLRSVYNTPFVFDTNSDKYEYICEVRSMSESTGHSVVVKTMLCKDDRTIKAELPYLKEPIPIGIVFKALGYITSDEISKLIGLDCPDTRRYIRFLVRDAFCDDINIGREYYKTNSNSGALWDDLPDIETDKWTRIAIINQSLKYIGARTTNSVKSSEVVNYARQIISLELFPHLGITAGNNEKGVFVGYMLNKLLSTKFGMRELDDRDNYVNKRIETPGILCHELFTQLFKKYREYIINSIEKKKNSPVDIIQIMSKNSTITSGLLHCFSTGNWGVPKTSYIRPGVSQVMSRLSYGATLSHTRRLCIPTGKEGKNTKIRQINPSQLMFVCPCETPEGQPVGIVMNFSLLTRVSERSQSYLIMERLDKCEHFISIKDNVLHEYQKIFVNGNVVGYSKSPEELVSYVRKLKQDGALQYDISVSYNLDDDEIRIYCDAGRLIRPVFTVSDDKLLITEENGYDWSELVKKGFITYIDNSEANESVIAFSQEELKKYRNDYCEIDASMILGVMGSIIPWPDHSQSPRNCYQTSMGKQAMSMYTLSHNIRTDTISHVLGYPQRPLVGTRVSEMMGFNEMPSGINAIVAIACYSGFNQEDSIIMNKGAVDRGMFTATSYRTHTDQEKKNGFHSRETICRPPLDKRKVDVNYSFLGEDGIVMKRFPNGKNIYLSKGDVIIGKCIIDSSKGSSEVREDCSLTIKKGEEGWVDRIIKSTTPDGYLMVKIVIRRERIPEVGDKFASRAAQKGTCGLVYPQQDMPWTSDGIVPDIIINPHCIPSRMTINQLMESVLGKTCCVKGEFGDATPFAQSTKDISQKLCDDLSMEGMNGTGTEILYNGFTGEPMGEFFIGPVYYQRLKHLVDEKMHARASGSVTTLTRQPLEGRSRDGGLRFGEMERDAMISHGTSMFLKERLCDVSDPYQVPICGQCGIISNTDTKCTACNCDDISVTGLPYVSKLVLQELNAMCIKTKIVVK